MLTKNGVKIENPRRIPTEGVFMHYDSDDLLYGLMYALATFHPLKQKLYLTKKNFTKNKKLFYEICNFTDTRMMRSHLKKLIDKGLLLEEDTDYFFPQDETLKYQIIERDMLQYLVNTRSKQAIRVYVILLDWYLWKDKIEDKFIFTNKDILKKLGYSTSNKNASAAITDILESFNREGVIKYEHFYETFINPEGKEVPTPKMRLVFVVRNKNQLKKSTI